MPNIFYKSLSLIIKDTLKCEQCRNKNIKDQEAQIVM